MIIPFLLAIFAALTWAVLNILDKFVISHRIRNLLSYGVMVGIANLTYGVILASFLDWSPVGLQDLLYPTLAGLLIGGQLCVTFFLFAKEDASYIQGFSFTYPILVALLSYFFLTEALHLQGYIGMAVTILGTLLLTLRLKKIRFKAKIWMILLNIFIVAASEFSIKLATTHLSPIHGVSINGIAIGLAILPTLFHRKTRNGFYQEISGFRWAYFNELFAFGGYALFYYAMHSLPATVVSSISTTQVLFVVILERIAHLHVGKMTRDTAILPKLCGTLLIVGGVVLLYLS